MSDPSAWALPGDPRPSELQEAGWLSIVLAALLRESFDEQAAALGLSHTAIKVLLQLDAERPRPMRSLAERLRYDPSNLTSVVDRLEHRGLVARRPDQEDRRVKALLLTSQGAALRERFWAGVSGSPGPLATLDPEELARYLELVRAAISRGGVGT